MLDIDQLPLVKKLTATNKEMATMEKKKMLASNPVSLISKLDRMYQQRTIPMATAFAISAGIGMKWFRAVRKMNAISGGSTTWTRNIIHWVLHPIVGP